MAKRKKTSPAYDLLSLVWEHALTETGHSWERLNRSMHGAMNLAIDSGFTFDHDTFARAMAEFRGGYWFYGEGYYSLAVQIDNLSAAQAFESYKDRQPFIADEVSTSVNCSYAHLVATRKRGRLAIGCTFPWKGYQVKVTSFSDDGTYLTACAYHERKANDYSNKVKKRFPITVAGIQAERALKRERERLRARLDKVWDNWPMGFAKRRLKRVGITAKEDWYIVPIEKIRTVVKELEKESKD